MNGAATGHAVHLRLDLDEPLISPLLPVARRPEVMLLWSIDRRLAELARSGREPALRQIRLRWWIERLAALGTGPSPAEPLLAGAQALLVGRIDPEQLAALGEAWEQEAVGEADDGARGALLFALTAKLLDDLSDDAAGRLWAGVERGLATDEGDWTRLRAMAEERWAKQHRALGALTALSREIARRAGRRSRWREQAVILRAGLVGR